MVHVTNPDIQRMANRRYYYRNREKILAKQKLDVEGNRAKYQRFREKKGIDAVRAYDKIRYWLTERDKRLEKHKRLRVYWREKLFEVLGRKCVRCGLDSDIRLLQFDHIKGGGRKDIVWAVSSVKAYRYYATNPEEAKLKLQTLCVSCNWLKRYDSVSS